MLQSKFILTELCVGPTTRALSARIELSFAVTHGQIPNQLPPTELLGLWRCEGDLSTRIGSESVALPLDDAIRFARRTFRSCDVRVRHLC
jgi:hypothetical protein